MVDRIIESPIEVPFCEDDLRTNRNFMVGLGKLAEALIGKQTVIQGLPCTPTIPASLKVLVGAGQIFSWENIDDAAYSELPADTTHQIVKQGLILDEVEHDCPAPVTVGFSINYLIQIAFLEVDDLNEERPFYDSADPSQPTYQYVDSQREDKCIVTVKTGTAAATGTQVTPAPDAGNVGAWVVTVDEGQTEIVAGDIVEYPGAPFINLYKELHSGTTTGTQPDYLLSIPGIIAYEEGLILLVKIHSTNVTGPATLDLNSLGVKDIRRSDGLAIDSGDLRSTDIYMMIYDGTVFRLLGAQRATQSSRGIIRLSTAAETKTATDDTICISPKNAVNHPGVAKAWVKFNGTTGAIYDSYNVASVTRNGLGDYTVNLDITMANDKYVVTCSTVQAGSAPYGVKPTTYILSQTTTSFLLEILGFNNTFDAVSNTDVDPIFIAVHGF